MSNVRSVLRPAEERISWKEKRQILSNLYGRGGLVVVCETGVVVHEAPPDSNRWSIEDYGIPTIISNLDELVISIADIDTAVPHREYSITLDADYKVQESYFHTFICEDDNGKDLLVGLSFANGEVARRIAEAVDQLTPGKLFKLTNEQRKSLSKNEISQPAEFKHVAHIGGDLPTHSDPIGGLNALERQVGNGAADMEVSEQKIMSPPQAARPSPSQGSEIRPSPPQGNKPTPPNSLNKNSQRKKSGQPKKPLKGGRRVLEISSPMEFQHVAHMGENCFAPKNEDGDEDPFQMSGDFSTGVAAARKRSKTPSTSSEQLLSSGSGEEPEVKKSRVPMDISSPHDFQHVSHISKDTAISAFMLTGKKDPFSIITAIANSPPTSSPPQPANLPPAPPPPPELPKLPSEQPPPQHSESPKIKSPKIKYPPAPPQLDSAEFLKEISSFNPSLLRHVSVDGKKKKPVTDPNSLQEVLKNSFENMRGKLQSMWRDSIITTFGDQLDGDDEFDYPGVFLPEDVLAELEQ